MKVRRYKNHIIEIVPCMGWSDSQQCMVPNGYKIHVSGPDVNLSQQTYVSDTLWIERAIDEKQNRGES